MRMFFSWFLRQGCQLLMAPISYYIFLSSVCLLAFQTSHFLRLPSFCRRHLLFESWLFWPPGHSNSSLRGHQLFTAARLHRGGCFASQLRSQHCFCHESPHSTVISAMWHLCIFVSRSCLCSSLIMSNACTYFLFSSLMTFHTFLFLSLCEFSLLCKSAACLFLNFRCGIWCWWFLACFLPLIN